MPHCAVTEENLILAQLPDSEFGALQTQFNTVLLPRGAVLQASAEPIEFVYFPLSGMISVLTVMRDGDMIDTAVIGCEGVLGGAAAIEGWRPFGQALVLLDGKGVRMAVPSFAKAYREHSHFRALVNRAQSLLFMQVQQSAACHAMHPLEARLCRWLLQAQDVAGSDVIRLTQEALSQMLGVQRNTVSLAAHALQRAGLIRYARGKITVLDREGLKDSACECYDVIREQTAAARGPL